jgi:hypothetical protein
MTIETATAPLPATTKKKVLSYYLKVKGIYGRNRKVKFDVFPVIKDVPSDSTMTPTEVRDMAMAVLADTVKGGYALLELVEQPEEVEEYIIEGTRYTSRCFAIFSDVKLFKLERDEGCADVITTGGK